MWPWVTSMTTCGRCDHMWQVWSQFGRLDIMDIGTSSSCGTYGEIITNLGWAVILFSTTWQIIEDSFKFHLNNWCQRSWRTFFLLITRSYSKIWVLGLCYLVTKKLGYNQAVKSNAYFFTYPSFFLIMTRWLAWCNQQSVGMYSNAAK